MKDMSQAKKRKFTADDRTTVRQMAAAGVAHKDIARVLDCAENTLRKHFRDELDTGATCAIAAVSNRLYDMAMKGNTAACIFWLKARAGWRERQEVTGPEGEPLFPAASPVDSYEAARRIMFALDYGVRAREEAAVSLQASDLGSTSPVPPPPSTETH